METTAQHNLNLSRSERTESAMQRFGVGTQERDAQTALADILTGLMHWVLGESGTDFDAALLSARQRFGDEISMQRQTEFQVAFDSKGEWQSVDTDEARRIIVRYYGDDTLLDAMREQTAGLWVAVTGMFFRVNPEFKRNARN